MSWWEAVSQGHPREAEWPSGRSGQAGTWALRRTRSHTDCREDQNVLGGGGAETHSGGLGSPEVAIDIMSREPCKGARTERRAQVGRDSSSG